MSRLRRNIAILAVGDEPDYDSYLKFNQEASYCGRYGFDYYTVNYKQFLKGEVPPIQTDKIIIFFFFPFVYWDKHIEHKKYEGIYGNRTFCKKFIKFWNVIEKNIKEYFAAKEVLFINDPRLCGFIRDKINITNTLSEHHIPQPVLYKTLGIKEIQDKLATGTDFFLKPRFGSMGKGITFLSFSSWETNFNFRKGKIISRKSDHGWKFRHITGNNPFLKELLKHDILIQEAVDTPILYGNKVDLRIYTFFNKTLYIYPRENAPDKITTNISQGGVGDPALMKILPKHLIYRATSVAERLSSVLNIRLAGIDIIPDKHFEDVYVIDVNAFSGFPKRKTFNLSREMIKELSQLDDRDQLRFTKVYRRSSRARKT